MDYSIRYSCVCDIGKRRVMNQDNFICGGRYLGDGLAEPVFPISGSAFSGEVTLLGVFDGMGGEERGEVASLIAARRAKALCLGDDPEAELVRYCVEANEEICEYTMRNRLTSMGTTAAMLAFGPFGFVLCNLGDSKIFRYASGALEQISRDHVAAAARGRKPPLLQNLGIPRDELRLEPYTASGGVREGDLFLICSDGLTDMVSLEVIRREIERNTFEALTPVLLRRALESGGRDNVTIIACRVEKRPAKLIRWLLGKRGA
ncbi:MAG: protein phosphatase 2C domain-containing protein [Clostridia bacterium]|nr:protein phosphatase 2C domain-containing protein [Clostridia bacterium]